jgi:hypothetical protein
MAFLSSNFCRATSSGADGVARTATLLMTAIARKCLAALLADKAAAHLLSDEHFSVDGTLLRAKWQCACQPSKHRRQAATPRWISMAEALERDPSLPHRSRGMSMSATGQGTRLA